ncbi:MAG: hypothetical protein ACRCUY_10240, partial [Thermoguttaceae bacterium]
TAFFTAFFGIVPSPEKNDERGKSPHSKKIGAKRETHNELLARHSHTNMPSKTKKIVASHSTQLSNLFVLQKIVLKRRKISTSFRRSVWSNQHVRRAYSSVISTITNETSVKKFDQFL